MRTEIAYVEMCYNDICWFSWCEHRVLQLSVYRWVVILSFHQIFQKFGRMHY